MYWIVTSAIVEVAFGGATSSHGTSCVVWHTPSVHRPLSQVVHGSASGVPGPASGNVDASSPPGAASASGDASSLAAAASGRVDATLPQPAAARTSATRTTTACG